MEGEKKWKRADERWLLELLLKHPGRVWARGELHSACSNAGWPMGERFDEVLHELWAEGAIVSRWDSPEPVRPHHPLDPRYAQQRRQQQRQLLLNLTPDGDAVIRNLLATGRPKSVIGTFLWEGGDNATAMIQAGKRERAHQRALRRQPRGESGPANGSLTISVLPDAQAGRLPWRPRLWGRGRG